MDRWGIGIALLAGVWLYTAGWARARQRADGSLATRKRLLAYVTATAVIAIALMSAIDTFQSRLFSIHMLQHMLLVYLAAPLLLLSRPATFWRQGLPAGLRTWPTGVREWRAAEVLSHLARPAVALGLSTVILWLWHIPTAYDLALENDVVHALEHLTFFGAFLLYWWPLIGSPSRLTTNAARTVYLAGGGAQSGFLGGIITFSPRVLYTHYLNAPRTGGLSALADQQLAGVVMWFPGVLIYGLAAALTMTGE
ncbi:MAG: cytochrome c oxidase assembly protein [Chloroflexi bacterium]|nr:cytochrome c oxidase assembly protein [Chloroflexota bacterium]